MICEITGEELSPEAIQLLERSRDRAALKRGDLKRIFRQYFESASEYEANTGKKASPVVFNIVPPLINKMDS